MPWSNGFNNPLPGLRSLGPSKPAIDGMVCAEGVFLEAPPSRGALYATH